MNNRNRKLRSIYFLTVLAVAAGAATIVATLLIPFQRDFVNVVLAIASTFAVLLAGIATYIVTIRPGEARGLNIALGGFPGVGKTVYVNILFRLLIERRDLPSVRFTPDPKTAQAVFVSTRELTQGHWPRSTTLEGVFRYRGRLTRTNISPLLVLLGTVRAVELEIGDAAGELWGELATESRSGRRDLVESNFFEYVSNSDVLFYFIDATALLSNPGEVRHAVDDLLLTVQLIESVRASRQPWSKVAVIVAKSDVLPESELRALYALGANPFHQPTEDGIDSADFLESLSQLSRVMFALNSIARHSQLFMVSAADDAVNMAMAPALPGVGSRRTHPPRADFTSVTEPLNWARYVRYR